MALIFLEQTILLKLSYYFFVGLAADATFLIGGPNSTDRALAANLHEDIVSSWEVEAGLTCKTIRVLLSPESESCKK